MNICQPLADPYVNI